mmetsp:Transcript_32041/g.106065  ORF Transcript_32041/g.106065 Transcript_32041/m.106065 type:complete len:425 (+) Transcript_32041:28-1302(+)
MGPLASGRPQCYSKPGINPHFVQSMRAVAQERAAAERSGAYFNERTALDEQLLSVFSEELPSGRTVSGRARQHLRGDASKSLRSLRNGHNPFDRAVIKPSCAHCSAGAGASTRGLVKHIFCPERKKFDSAVEAEAVEIFRRSLVDAYSCHLAGKLIATVEQGEGGSSVAQADGDAGGADASMCGGEAATVAIAPCQANGDAGVGAPQPAAPAAAACLDGRGGSPAIICAAPVPAASGSSRRPDELDHLDALLGEDVPAQAGFSAGALQRDGGSSQVGSGIRAPQREAAASFPLVSPPPPPPLQPTSDTLLELSRATEQGIAQGLAAAQALHAADKGGLALRDKATRTKREVHWHRPTFDRVALLHDPPEKGADTRAADGSFSYPAAPLFAVERCRRRREDGPARGRLSRPVVLDAIVGGSQYPA